MATMMVEVRLYAFDLQYLNALRAGAGRVVNQRMFAVRFAHAAGGCPSSSHRVVDLRPAGRRTAYPLSAASTLPSLAKREEVTEALLFSQVPQGHFLRFYEHEINK
jgi:hypothetical protein